MFESATEQLRLSGIEAKALPIGRALEEIRRCAGTQFDPRIVAVFGDVIGDAGHVQTQFDKIVSTYDVQPAPDEITG